MFVSLLALALTASAQDPDAANRRVAANTNAVPDWSVKTYTAPDSAIEILCAQQVPGDNECLTVHLVVAVGAGVQFNYKTSPGWFGEVRGGGQFRYGLLSGGYGLQGNIGSFWGVDDRYYRFTMGPEVIGNLYQGADYILSPGVGVGWELLAVAKPWENFWIHASAEPAWYFGSRRGTGAVFGVADELINRIGVRYQGGPIIGGGYTYRHNAAGRQHGFYISGSF